jgi:hypothetical protein
MRTGAIAFSEALLTHPETNNSPIIRPKTTCNRLLFVYTPIKPTIPVMHRYTVPIRVTRMVRREAFHKYIAIDYFNSAYESKSRDSLLK